MRALRGALLAACATGGMLGGALPAHAMTLFDDDQQRLRNEDIVVEGQREKKSASSGTKTDVPLIATAQSITVIDQEELTRRNALSINQALGYVAGVAPNQRGNVATRYDQLFLRGFAPGMFMDGMRLMGGVYASPQIDFHLVESVDVVKGPAGVTYGSGTPGGLVNLTSKLPYAGPGGRIELAAGNYALLRSSIDVNQPLDENDRWLFRMIAGAEESDGFIRNTANRRYYARPMLTFAPDKATSVTLILNYQRDPESGSYSGVPVYGSALPNPFGVLPVDFNTSEPSYEAFDRTQKSATILFRHDLNDRLSWTTNARYLAIGLHYRQIYGSGYVTRGGNSDLSTLQRGGGGSDEAFQTFTIDNHLVGKLDTGPVKHTILGGVDWQHNRGENYQAFFTGQNANPVFNIPNLSLFAPVYGMPLPSFPITQTHNYTKRDQVGVYLQDQIAIGGLQLIASGRWDTYNQTTQNLNTNVVTRLNQTAFTTRLGALYETKIGLSPFVSYSESFEPQAGSTWDGSNFIPVTGRQYEAGLKYQPRGTTALFTLSAFDLRRRNVPVADPRAGTGNIPSNSQVQIGEVSVRGIELDGRGTVAPGFDVVVAATYNDPYVRQGTPVVGNGDQMSGVTGTRPLGVPQWSASSFLSYDLGKAGVGSALGGLSLGAGVRYVGESDGTATTVAAGRTVVRRFQSPDYWLADLMLGYDLGRVSPAMEGLSFTANVANLFDKRHITSCFFNNGCYYGASRTFVGSLRYSW
ncbi:TonB-dependent siderophore receptor [Sphingomonas sanguinis]|uniref:TonB-dependent siderophore receptor n=1 Tax=Sphingomonas sanguinis TaxID=33051 RepID=UPI001C566699|nr:TonB-dependent siderophore receptor [Sphingomonas sanguinis]QXT34202.1 TonB-dependent siderophore receptor [Sphingomonas sanguinis]